MRCRSCLCALSLLVRVASSLPALPLVLPSVNLTRGGGRSGKVGNTVDISKIFPIADSGLALRFWGFGDEVDPCSLQSILIVSAAFLQEQIDLHGHEARPLNGRLQYDLGDGLEILITKMPEDPDGLDWSKLQSVAMGLWNYIVVGGRYRKVNFDVLDMVNDLQLGWGHIVEWGIGSLSNRTAKRSLQSSTPTLLSSANLISSTRNSSLVNTVDASRDWPVEGSDITLRFSSGSSARERALDPEVVKSLFAGVIEFVQTAIGALGEKGELGSSSFHYGSPVHLEVINSPKMLNWNQLATVVLGLVDFMIDHDHCQSYYFTIFTGNPKVETAIGQIGRIVVQHENVTIARRNVGDGGGVG